MSEVISFRLDSKNPREAKALAVINAWQVKGYSIRYIITEALLNLDPRTNTVSEDLNTRLDQITRLLTLIDKSKPLPAETESDNGLQPGLTASFIASIKTASKPGIKPDQ
jgi:hypothetical protein